MDGGPSQVDTFDPKPRLTREHGEPIKMQHPPTQFIPHDSPPKVLASPWKFDQHGEAASRSAICSRTSPTASMTWPSSARWSPTSPSTPTPTTSCTPARTSRASPASARGSPTAWAASARTCPATSCFATAVDSRRRPRQFPQRLSARHLSGLDLSRPAGARRQPAARRAQRRAAARQARPAAQARSPACWAGMGADDRIEAAIANYELAFRMQTAVPELLDLTGETEATKRLYGLDDERDADLRPVVPAGPAAGRARRALRRADAARPSPAPTAGTSTTSSRTATARTPGPCDKPIAGLLKDLKARGLLDETLVVWAGEFGRTPVAQGIRRPRPQPLRLHDLAGRRRHQGRHHLRRHRRIRLPRHREQGRDPRPARHDAAPARHRPHAADLPLRRPRHAADRRPWRDHRGRAGLIDTARLRLVPSAPAAPAGADRERPAV